MASVTGSLSPEEFVGGVNLFCDTSKSVGDDWSLKEVHNNNETIVFMTKRAVFSVDVANNQENVRTFSNSDKNDQVEHLDADMGDLHLEDDDASFSAEVVSSDGAQSVSNVKSEVRTFEWHVVYSESYQVPVLYFNVYHTSGDLVSLEDVWALVPEHYQQRLSAERWTFLTQQEHPVLHCPFYQLHPCHTEKFMQRVAAMQNTIQGTNKTSSSNICVSTTNVRNEPDSGSKDSYEISKDKQCTTDVVTRDIVLSSTSLRGYHYLVAWLSAIGPVVKIDVPLKYACVRLHEQT